MRHIASQPNPPISRTFTCFAEEENVVGYNTINITKQYTLLTVNFKSTSDEALTINEAFPYAEGMTAAKGYTAADNIQVMREDGGYDTYFLSNGDYSKSSHSTELENKWAKAGSSVVSEDKLAPGATFWYVSRGAASGSSHTITTAGQVSNAESETYTINKTYTLIGCPYPVEVALNGGIEVEGATAAKGYTAADNIQIMRQDGGYDTYFLSNGDYSKSSHSTELENKWAKAGTSVVTTDKFPVGGGAWYVSRSKSGSIKFLNPIAK